MNSPPSDQGSNESTTGPLIRGCVSPCHALSVAPFDPKRQARIDDRAAALRSVGRDSELCVISEFVNGPGPSALLVEGDAGIGKTTLVRDALELARSRGLRVFE